jgi:deoxyribodipyrimidine photo-lyase
MSTIGIHIFRRDYRLHDNTSLIELCSKVDIVIPIFIFTTKQITNNPYRSDNCIQFLCESLIDLNQQLSKYNSKLYIFYGDEFKVLEDIISCIMKTNSVKYISFNKDMTAYSQERDLKLIKEYQNKNIEIINLDDITLQPLGTVLTGNGNMFTKFTPYYRSASKLKVNDVMINHYKNYVTSRHHISDSIRKLKHSITSDDMMKENGFILGKKNTKLIDIPKVQ